MEYSFSKNVAGLRPSAIREILKYTSLPGYIPFAAGNPAPEALPTERVAAVAAELFRRYPTETLQYSVTEGYPPLRDALKSFLRERYGLGTPRDELIVTSGAQQVMSLAAMVLCDPGDTVICENPSFIGSLNAFRSFGLRLCGVPMESDGMDVDALERALRAHPDARFIYTIPTFQNPSGACMSLAKRRRVYALAKEYGVPVLEDDPYRETRFSGEDLPPIKSFDTDGLVIYAGTFSKIISPGMRVGYTLAPAEVVQKMVVCKQTSDVHSNILGQMICREMLTAGDFGDLLARIKDIYRAKCALMTGLLDEKMAGFASYVRPEGGLFIWCRLPDGCDMMKFCEAGVSRKVAVVPGTAFAADTEGDCARHIRLNFSTPTDAQIAEGMGVLGELARGFGGESAR